jgi:hypothetical protein
MNDFVITRSKAIILRPSKQLKLFAMICLLAAVCGDVARGQVVDPVDNYLSSAEQKANNVVYNAGAQGKGVAMEAGQAALNAIGSFRAAYADSLKLSQNALTGQQEVMFQKIKSSMALLNESLSTSTKDLQTVADTLAAAISNLPLNSNIPRIVRLGPLYIVDNQDSSQELVIHGVGLANGDPHLINGSDRLEPNTKTDTEIRFRFPPHGAVTNKPLLLAVHLELFERREKYLGLSSDDVPRNYPIRLAIYPPTIGQVTVTPRRRVSKAESNPVSTPEYRCESPHGEGSSSVPVSVAPTPGWTFDVSTIKWNESYRNNGSFTMNGTAATGFTATLTCSGFGIKKIAGQTIDAGSQGVVKGTFSYTEVRQGSELQNGPPQSLTLAWDDSRTVSDLPSDTETVLFELKPFTGQTLDLDGAGANRFARFDFNASAKVATITATSIEQALRQ